jgi:hypothetical protein
MGAAFIGTWRQGHILGDQGAVVDACGTQAATPRRGPAGATCHQLMGTTPAAFAADIHPTGADADAQTVPEQRSTIDPRRFCGGEQPS